MPAAHADSNKKGTVGITGNTDPMMAKTRPSSASSRQSKRRVGSIMSALEGELHADHQAIFHTKVGVLFVTYIDVAIG